MSAIAPDLHNALSKVMYPGFSLDIVTMNLVQEAGLDDNGLATVTLRPLSAPAPKQQALEQAITRALLAVPQVTKVEIGSAKARAASMPQASHISGIDKIIAVASCKGGVGKSTLAVNLAYALAAGGLKTGLLDLDIYGPSLPTMLNLEGSTIDADENDNFIPLNVAPNLKAISVGFMSNKDQPLSWRGPLLNKIVDQLLHRTAWQGLNLLIIDLPPGTGDVQLSLLRHIILSGIVIVSTPEGAAISDTRRGISLFRQANTPIVGLVENMSYYICTCCGNKQYLFGRDTVRPLAAELGLDFLGGIPLNPAGQEPATRYNETVVAPYRELAAKLQTYLKG